MPTPLREVVTSPPAANLLAQHFADAEDAARQPDSALLSIHKVGRAAVQQLRAWQAQQDPPIPVPPDPFGPEQLAKMVSQWSQSSAPYVEVQRDVRVMRLARAFYREWVNIDRERNMPVDHAAVRTEAYEAAEAFYPKEEA